MEIITTFEASTNQDQFFIWISLAVILISAAAGAFLLLKKPANLNYNMRMLLAMLCFFSFIIAAGTLVFSFLTQQKLSPVVLYTNAIETPYGQASFENISDVYFEKNPRKTVFGASKDENYRLLIIEEKGKKGHLLSEANYPINQIAGELKEAMRSWQK